MVLAQETRGVSNIRALAREAVDLGVAALGVAAIIFCPPFRRRRTSTTSPEDPISRTPRSRRSARRS